MDAELVKSRWCSEIWSIRTVVSRGIYAFQRLLTFSKSLGFTLCGMVEEPTTGVLGSAAFLSRSSRSSLLCKWRKSSAILARTPQQDVRAYTKSATYSG